jgi:hypothetical protein
MRFRLPGLSSPQNALHVRHGEKDASRIDHTIIDGIATHKAGWGRIM